MTGHGEAQGRRDGVTASVEVRAINNRYFKLSFKSNEGYNALEGEVDGLVRKSVKRGAVQVSLRVVRPRSAEDYQLNREVLLGYCRQLEQLRSENVGLEPISLAPLLQLPGVVDEVITSAVGASEDWPLIEETLESALAALDAMRAAEGRAMEGDLRSNLHVIARELSAIAEQAPKIVAGYRTRLTERLKATLAEFQVTLDPSDVLKEVGIVAERSDISEEIVRLRSHLDQFERIMNEPESAGRKLEFLTQELLREANTIGAKANDIAIARGVIEIKSAIERIREMIQNVE